MEERRISPRLAINQFASLVVGDSIKPIPCTVEDISASGMRVSLSKYLFPEVFSNVSFALTDNFSFDVGANVRWQESTDTNNTYGITFTRIEDSDRSRIEQFVNSSLEEDKKSNWWREP